MAPVERRDKEPREKEQLEQQAEPNGGGVSRREFLVGTGAGAAGLVIGGVVGREVLGKPAAVPTAPGAAEVPAAEGEVPAAAVEYKADHTLVFDPYQCTGCMKCAVACAEKWGTELHPEETKNLVNLELSRIRPTRFQFVDVVNVCSYCSLEEWAEGSSNFPCAEVCPEEAIFTVPEGEGKEGFYGMGYKWIDREKCLGVDKCWRCLEICEDQFGSAISFDPIDRKAQVCSRCGGDPECVKACPEPQALQFVPVGRNGRYFAHQPAAYGELLYRKMFNKRRSL
jgi:carbon-monoxide dehydrogenase iron sulfur subunit